MNSLPSSRRAKSIPATSSAIVYRAIAQREDQIKAYISIAPPEHLLQGCERLRDRPLRGLPIAVKDNISTVDLKTTCASTIPRRLFSRSSTPP
jgi:Asp-tRNA(Asn)/Glu-tRNA(Gln) amidotransferase A subunit family amidase